MLRPPTVIFAGCSVHAALDETEIRWCGFAGAIAQPDMSAVAVHFIVEGVVDCHIVATVRIDGGSKHLKPGTMAGLIIVAGMAPRRRDEEVCVDRLVQKGIYSVEAWAKFEQRPG